MHLGETDDRLVTSHLQCSPQVLMMVVGVVEVGWCHTSADPCVDGKR